MQSAIRQPPSLAAHRSLAIRQAYVDGWHGLVFQAVGALNTITSDIHGLEYQTVPPILSFDA